MSSDPIDCHYSAHVRVIRPEYSQDGYRKKIGVRVCVIRGLRCVVFGRSACAGRSECAACGR